MFETITFFFFTGFLVTACLVIAVFFYSSLSFDWIFFGVCIFDCKFYGSTFCSSIDMLLLLRSIYVLNLEAVILAMLRCTTELTSSSYPSNSSYICKSFSMSIMLFFSFVIVGSSVTDTLKLEFEWKELSTKELIIDYFCIFFIFFLRNAWSYNFLSFNDYDSYYFFIKIAGSLLLY